MTPVCWVLWFTISIGPNQIGHFPVDGTFPSGEACVAEAKTHWIPLLESQFPNDPHVALYCKPCVKTEGV